MKRIFSFFAACCLVLSASAANHFVSQAIGDDNNDGLSWSSAKQTIAAGFKACGDGDTLFVAQGLYNERVTIKAGSFVSILGGYNASNGQRNIDLYETIMDGTDLGKILVKSEAEPTLPILIEGLTLQNAEYSSSSSAVYMRGNMTVNRCLIRNCHSLSSGGAIYVEIANAEHQAIISNSIFELCQGDGGGGAIYNKGALIENCIFRGCIGKYATIYNKSGIIRNCLIHNCEGDVSDWPNSGGIYNPGGKVFNCTLANNWGSQYAGIHSDGQVSNTVMWNNQSEEGYTDVANYIASGTKSHNNIADQGRESSNFKSLLLGKDNEGERGPRFRAPTNFVGLPKNAGEIAAMRAADFSITEGSYLIDKGRDDEATETDINGTVRPKGDASDVGAYEYDPEMSEVHVTGVAITVDTLFVYEEQVDGLAAIVTPKNATNKKVQWSIDNSDIATIDNNGAVTGVKEGKTKAHVTTEDGGFTDFAIVVVSPKPPVKFPDEVIAADELYQQADYTVPSFIPFLIAKEAARIDSLSASEEEIASIAGKLEAMNEAINSLVPKEEPYNLIANINGDPRTRMAFNWFTNEGVEKGFIQLLPKADATPEEFANGQPLVISATATTTPPLAYAVSTSGILKAANLDRKTAFVYVSHKALAEDLQPGTDYSYRVGYEGHWSPVAHFRTADAEQGEFSFIYMTDSHIQDAEYVENARWCAEAAANTVPEARFCLFPGDFVETGTKNNSEWEWERWFEESIRPVIMQMPIVPTDGNHDDSENLNYDHHFNTDRQFNVVAKTKPQFNGITYSFVYSDVLFLVYSLQDWWRASGSSESTMTSSYLSTDVRNWFLEQCAAYPDTKYRVALSHKNIFSGSGHSVDSETPMFREIMLPIFKACEIDLAIQGHDHCYEVIGPVDPDTRTAITAAISDVEDDTYNAETNMTGKKGGTYVTDDGTLYFIGATCGRKRYYPYSRAEMEENFSKHKVENYFDLFTGMFGQPKAPSFTKFTVKEDAIELNSYKASSDGTASLFNTMQVKRTKPHSKPNGFDYIPADPKEGQKFIRDGHLYILRNGRIFDATGKLVQ